MRDVRSSDSGATLGERYRVLLDIGRTLAGTLSLSELFGVLYRETARVLEAAGFFVALYDDANDLATVVFSADRGVESREEFEYPGSQSEAIRTGKPQLTADRGRVASLLVIGEENGAVTRSAISAPLLHKGKTLGLISVQSYEPGAYGEADLELLQGIADIAAVAIENAHFVAELDRQKRESERIEEIGRALASSLDGDEVLSKVIESAMTLASSQSSSVWLIDGKSATVAASAGEDSLTRGLRWTLGGALYAGLVQERSPVCFDAHQNDPFLPEGIRLHIAGGAGIAVPLIVNDEVAGALSAERSRGAAFTAEDRGVLGRLASQASVALENAGLHQSLQALSLTDALTGLPNRRHLEMHLELEVAAAQRGRDLVVVIFDLDKFKQFNDTRGHLAGDEALQRFGAILIDENRASNLVARLGGDEFVCVLSETDEAGAGAYVDRIRRRVAADELLAGGGISVSSGRAPFDPTAMSTIADVLQAADEALYDEKAVKGSPGR